MSNTTPPQMGLTKTRTGWKHPLFPDWDIDDDEMPEIERRAKYRHSAPEEAPELPTEPQLFNNHTRRQPKVCPTCERSFVPRVPWQSFCKRACRHKDEMRRQREKRNGKAVATP